jgi:2-C-methyl-D-erythritol 4-phosphate cytidylyltransferase
MLDGHRIGALILTGGSGSRFGGDLPKQFLFLCGKRVYLHTLEVFEKIGLFDEIVLVCHPEWLDIVCQEAPSARIISGGATRQESAYLGLQGFAKQPEIVCIHDAVRPFVSPRILQENVEQALRHGAVDTCIPSADTLVYAPQGKTIASIPKREEFLRGQTPQTFRYPLIWHAHQKALTDQVHATDDCSLVLRQGHPIHVVAGSEENIKITTTRDLLLAEALLEIHSTL